MIKTLNNKSKTALQVQLYVVLSIEETAKNVEAGKINVMVDDVLDQDGQV